MAFSSGSVLVLASDGLTEQLDAYGAEFGLERLSVLAAAARHTTPRAALARLFASVDSHAGAEPATDDRAAIVITAGVDA
jgi:serine phosphatase RsbU (regulator of sigma subunit)